MRERGIEWRHAGRNGTTYKSFTDMDILFFDFETRSELNLKDVGAHKYATHHSTEILLISYAFNSGPVQVSREVPEQIIEMMEDPDILKVAHNAEFDMAIAKYVLGVDLDNVCNNPYRGWHDTAYQAAYYGYPRALADLAGVLGTGAKASPEEMHFFSAPKRLAAKADPNELFGEGTPTVYNEMDDYPEERDRFIEYSRVDTEVMRECYHKMKPLPEFEDYAMRFTFMMNFNGIPFDLQLATKIKEMADDYSRRAGSEALAEYGIANLRSTPQVLKALAANGVVLKSLNKKERGGVTHPILDLRDQATGAAFSKIESARDRICADSRLHGEFVGFGAHTGRWSSRGVQAQNFPRILSEVSDDLSNVRDYDHLRQHLRLCIHAQRSQMFTCADLSQIEARITAWLAGCRWRQDAFANEEDIYSRSAERMFGLPHVDKSMPERQMGKCAELGLGFGGGAGAIARVAPDFYAQQGDAKVREIVDRWRNANPEVCQLWRTLERAFRSAYSRAVQRVTLGPVGIVFKFDGRTMYIGLPSGRGLYYRQTVIAADGEILYRDYSRGSSYGITTKIWGGVLTENVVQAIARDVLMDIMRRVETKYGFECIGTVHDEVWYLADATDRACEFLLDEMRVAPTWAPGLVIKGDGFTNKRYIK